MIWREPAHVGRHRAPSALARLVAALERRHGRAVARMIRAGR